MKKRTKIIALVLYALPILFFIIGYFLLTTSGEDIHQGAGRFGNYRQANIINDAKQAFEHSGRITDMYAWSIIDLYDYQYNFGLDTIFRILDVAIITVTLYLATFFVLEYKPKLQLKDALTFCGIFVSIAFTMFGRQLYSEFSMIHNYVPLIFINLLFAIPYFKLLLEKPFSKHLTIIAIAWAFLGVIFGLSTTITPIAFLLATIIYTIINRKKQSKLPFWFYTGLIGIIIGFCISFFLSSGVNNYTNDPISAVAFDYISFSEIIENPFHAIPHILFHLIYNFSIVLLPLIVLTFIAVIFSRSYHQVFTKHPLKTLSPHTKKLLLSFFLFISIHILATAQIKSPPRILIPTYLAGVILIFNLFIPYIKSKLLGSVIIVLTIVAVIIHTAFLSIYHAKTTEVLSEIKNSPEPALCIERSRVDPPRIPLINLSQEFILVDWGYPEPIYGKDITFCK